MIDRRSAAAQRSEGAYRVWPAHPGQLTLLRVELRRWLTSLEVSENARENMVLAVGEAAANAIEHAYPQPTGADTVEVSCSIEPGAICFEVVDHGVWLPPPSEPDGRGHGMSIMRGLAESVLIRHGPLGTTVLLRCATQVSEGSGGDTARPGSVRPTAPGHPGDR
jgi:serine/threonine-protein kinase RsbW